MKRNENFEILLALIVLIFLSMISIFLIVKKEKDSQRYDYANEINESTEEELFHLELVDTDQKGNQSNKIIFNDDNENMEEVKKNDELPVELTKNDQKDSQNINTDEFYLPSTMKQYEGEEFWQLEELFSYWNDYQLDAVDDLIHLPRVRQFTKDLRNSDNFYYYGDLNKDGMPEGRGLAVYSDDRYYCGEWSNGKRNGKGMWLQIFPDELGTVKSINAVTEHSYNGEWLNDLPNGEGQEHISYDYSAINPSKEPLIANVIGGFKDGFYNENLYIMSANEDEKQIDWEAKAKKGQFVYCNEEKNILNKRAVWERMNADAETDPYHWIYTKNNMNHGIDGLKKMQ